MPNATRPPKSKLPFVVSLLALGALLMSVRLAGSAPTLAVVFTVSACNAGIAAGSSIGGHTLDTSLGATGPATVGVAMVALGLIPLIALATKSVNRTDTSETEHRLNPCAAQAVPAI